jgi:hypothetical protein
MSRIAVTEIEGYTARRPPKLGLSCMVVDTAYNYRVLATYRSEDRHSWSTTGRRGSPPSIGHNEARARARAHAQRLNATLQPAS